MARGGSAWVVQVRPEMIAIEAKAGLALKWAALPVRSNGAVTQASHRRVGRFLSRTPGARHMPVGALPRRRCDRSPPGPPKVNAIGRACRPKGVSSSDPIVGPAATSGHRPDRRPKVVRMCGCRTWHMRLGELVLMAGVLAEVSFFPESERCRNRANQVPTLTAP